MKSLEIADTASWNGSARLRAMTLTPVILLPPNRMVPVIVPVLAKKPGAGYIVEAMATSSAWRVWVPMPGP